MEMGLKQAKKIVIDLGLVIECKEEELLPERLLCAWRMCRPDLTQTVNIDWRVCWKKQGIGATKQTRQCLGVREGEKGVLPLTLTRFLY